MQQTGLRTFYILVVTQMLSMIGSRVTGLALGIYIYNTTGDATPLSIVAFFALLPMVLMTSVAGIFADRYNRRIMIALSDLGQAFCTLLLVASFASGAFELWHLYAIVALQSVFGVFQGPAFMASMTMLVPDEQRPRANALYQVARPLAGIFAPALAGIIYAMAGVVGALLLDLATFLVAFAVVMSVDIPNPKRKAHDDEKPTNMLSEWLDGLRYLFNKEGMMFLVLLIAMINFLFAGTGVLLTPYLLAITGDEALFGVLISVFNLGGIAGGIVFGIWGGTKKRMYTALPAVLFMSVALMSLGTARHLIMTGIILFFMMFPVLIINSPIMALFQSKIAPDMQGRVFALLEQFSMLLQPLSVLLVGPLADNVFEPLASDPNWLLAGVFGSETGAGIGFMFFIAGASAFVLTVIFLLMPSVRDMDTRLPDYVIEPDISQPDIPQDEANLATTTA